MNFLTILIAILIFGGLIFIHELGHYLTARLFDVHILEFAIGMGPKLLSKKSKKTGIVYSLRALPFGGFVSMVGEDDDGLLYENGDPASKGGAGSFSLPTDAPVEEDTQKVKKEDPRALCRKPVWQRMIIMAAGGVMNILLGVVLAAVLVGSMEVIGGTMVGKFEENAISQTQGLQVGDVITHVNGKSVYTHLDLAYAIAHDGHKPVELTVRRGAEIKRDDQGVIVSYKGGEELLLTGITFGTEEAEGIVMGVQDFRPYQVQKTVGNVVKQTFCYARLAIRQVWDGLTDLIIGRLGVEQMSGPVGVTQQIGQAASIGVTNLIFLVLVITMNLGVFNLLPIPALDGGRLFFLLIELIFRKPIPRDLEARINFGFLALLMLFMLFITCKDVLKMFVK